MSLKQQDQPRFDPYLSAEAGPIALYFYTEGPQPSTSMSSAYFPAYRLASPPQYAHGHFLFGQMGARRDSSTSNSSAEMQPIKKRKPRSSLACTVCRHKKSRCDGDGQNACSHCAHHGKQCKYEAVPKEVNDRIRGQRKRAKLAKQQALLQLLRPY